ncbi:MAG: hypothetical protein BGO78_10040 [Chloroflexi bacterium 44-23]|nr:MAG: hypothetical protein BGO78_10040 [Chloroflexi bacterium 44-23]
MRQKFLKNITKWIIYAIYLVLLLALIIGIVAAVKLNQINANIIELSQVHDAERMVLSEIRYRFSLIDSLATRYLEDFKQGNLLLYQQAYADLNTFLDENQAVFSDSPKKELYGEIKRSVQIYENTFQNIDESHRVSPGKNNDDFTFYSSQFVLHKNNTLDAIAKLSVQVESDITQTTLRSLDNISQTRLLLTVLIIMMIITGPLFGYVIIQQVNQYNRQKNLLKSTTEDFQKRLQDQKSDLSQAIQETKQFAYIVSHDLRSSLTNLKGFTRELDYSLDQIKAPLEKSLPGMQELERQKVSLALKQDIPEAINYINNSVNRMESFINAVLKLSRLGRKQLTLTQIDPNPLVEEIVANLAYQLELREGVVYAQKLPIITADQTSLEQVFANILDNAIKYWYQGRPLEINITAKDSSTETIFAIKDNGRGIAPEDMDGVFALFRRVGSSSEAGEGMGMAYVQAIIRNMDGRIWIESKVSVGTTVFFSIPKEIIAKEIDE